MASFTIKKGLDIRLVGPPAAVVTEVPEPLTVTVYPQEHEGIKARPDVKEGDSVRRGSVLYHDKRHEGLKFRSPASGRVQSVVFGPRRVLEQIVVEVEGNAAESFARYPAGQLAGLSRDVLLAQLLDTGLLTLLRQRPFSRMADPAVTPKAIFVNAMNTAPFQPDANVVLAGQEAAFQAGLDVLSRLTSGAVHLCLDQRLPNAAALTGARHAQVHTFRGPHPSGNSSIHISRLAPIKPGDAVWTARVADVVMIGQLFLTGEYPTHRVISLAGPGVQEPARKYYRVRLGAPLQGLFRSALGPGELRIVSGDILSGRIAAAHDSLRLFDYGFTVLREDRERHLLGWTYPGFSLFSASKAFVSAWLPRSRRWDLGTNQHGELRAMVLTGLYDKYLPLNILTDYLVRAVLANDTDEAIKLGILETDPEDFALCAFACPSKMDLVGIIRRGLRDIEKEGI